jgi:hypothetical protein
MRYIRTGLHRRHHDRLLFLDIELGQGPDRTRYTTYIITGVISTKDQEPMETPLIDRPRRIGVIGR